MMTTPTNLRTITRFGVLFFFRGALPPVPVAPDTPFAGHIK